MLKPVLTLTALLAAGLVTSVHAEPTPAHSAVCVAALKSRAEPLAQRVRRGDTVAEAQLLPIVTASFAFIGMAYKHGIRGAQADELLRNAEKAQTQVPPGELERIQDACHSEGQQLLAQANFFERQFVVRAARRRVERLHPG